MHSSQLIAPAHRSFIRIVAGTSDTHRFFYRVTNTRSRNRHIFRKLIRDNSPREHLSLSLFTGKWRRQTILSIYRNTKKHTRDLTPRSTSAFLSARFPLFCAWPLLPRKKKKKKKRKTINKVSQRDRGEIEFFQARRSVILARGETFFPFVHTNLRLFPTDARSLFWILPRFSPLHDRAEYLYIKGIVSP